MFWFPIISFNLMCRSCTVSMMCMLPWARHIRKRSMLPCCLCKSPAIETANFMAVQKTFMHGIQLRTNFPWSFLWHLLSSSVHKIRKWMINHENVWISFFVDCCSVSRKVAKILLCIRPTKAQFLQIFPGCYGFSTLFYLKELHLRLNLGSVLCCIVYNFKR